MARFVIWRLTVSVIRRMASLRSSESGSATNFKVSQPHQNLLIGVKDFTINERHDWFEKVYFRQRMCALYARISPWTIYDLLALQSIRDVLIWPVIELWFAKSFQTDSDYIGLLIRILRAIVNCAQQRRPAVLRYHTPVLRARESRGSHLDNLIGKWGSSSGVRLVGKVD